MMTLGPRRLRRAVAVASLGVAALALAAAAIFQGLDSSDAGVLAPSAMSPAWSAGIGTSGATPLVSTSPTSSAGLASAGPGTTPSVSPGAGIVAVRIEMPRLAIDLPIVEGDGIEAPLHKAAHYPGSAWPDGGSNIYIYAHAQTGMFLNLWGVHLGDEVILTLVDSSTRTYQVAAVMPRVPWDNVRLLGSTPDEQLTLQTSTSYYATAPRFVVIARPVR